MAFGRLGAMGGGFGRVGAGAGAGGGVAAAAGGAGLLVGETNGFATDFTHATDSERVAVKTAGTVVASGLDAFYSNAGTSPKQVFDVSGNLVWSPHNVLPQSQNLQLSWTFLGGAATTATFFRPDTANSAHRVMPLAGATAIIGDTWTYSAIVSAGGYSKIGIIESGTNFVDVSFDLNAGTKLYQAAAGNGTITSLGGGQYLVTNTIVLGAATARFYLLALPDSYVTGVVGGAWVPDGVKGINIHRQQTNRGTVPTAYLQTTTAARYGLAVDYDPVTHAALGLLVEPAATNLLLNSTTLSTQSVTVTAVAHTLSFLGTGTITLTGVSTAGPLVGTGVGNRVSLTFTPTAGSLTCTVSGTVSNAQLEIGTVATSPIPTFAVTQTRAADNYTFLLSQIPALGAEYSIYERFSTPIPTNTRCAIALTDGTANENVMFRASSSTVNFNIVDGGVSQMNAFVGTLVADVSSSATYRVKLNDVAGSVNGSAVSTDATVTLPTVTEVRFGGTGTNAAAIAVFRIQKLMLVPRGWDNATLVAKSAV